MFEFIGKSVAFIMIFVLLWLTGSLIALDFNISHWWVSGRAIFGVILLYSLVRVITKELNP